MANTQKGSRLYVCTTPQPNNLTVEEFEELEYIEVKKVGRIGETGPNTNIVSYPTLDTEVSDKAKGLTNAGDPEVEVARVYNDPGQMALRQMGAPGNTFKYAFKIIRADAPDETFTDRVEYQRGIVTGPRKPNGSNEDFDLEIFTLGLVQLEVVVEPEQISS